jgi:hypothetical protein
LLSIDSDAGGRACIFCGGSPVTAEHVWPRWIAKYLPDAKAEHYVVVEAEGREEAVEYRGERVPFSTTVRCVCKPCNEGWMAELERTAEHELHAMIEGRAQTLHEWRQSIAATWAFKTAIMVEQAQADLRAIPTEVYRLFRQYLTAPPFSQVWLALYAGDSPHFYGRGSMRLVITAPAGVAVPDDLTAYGACLQVGALAFRLFGHLIQNGPRNVPTGRLADALVQIRPTVARAEWPLGLAVDDNGLHMLVKSMGEDVTGAAQE